MPGFKNILTIKNKHVHINLERSQVEDAIDRFGGAEGQICPSHQCFLFVKKGEKLHALDEKKVIFQTFVKIV